MNELNLIPQEFREAKELKSKKIKNIILIVAGLLFIITLSCIPLYNIYKIKAENFAVETKIGQLAYVQEQINTLTQQKTSMQERMNALNSISGQINNWSNIISEISEIMPQDISLTSFGGGLDGISLQCNSKTMDSIAVFYGKLENSDIFTDIKINDISPNIENSSFSFSLLLKLKTGESKVK